MNAPQGFIPPDDLPPDDVSTALASRELLIGTWTVDGVHGEGGMLEPVPQGTEVSIAFDADGSLIGRTGDNRFVGSWKLAADGLRLSEPALTLVTTSNEHLGDLERRLLAALPAVVAFEVEGAHHRGALELIGEHGRALVRARRS